MDKSVTFQEILSERLESLGYAHYDPYPDSLGGTVYDFIKGIDKTNYNRVTLIEDNKRFLLLSYVRKIIYNFPFDKEDEKKFREHVERFDFT